jgi:hypothetical protein
MVRRIPVDTGRLRATHYVTPPEETGSGHVAVEVGLGTDYAVFVHEDTSAHHPSGEAKFLENALAARTPGFAERLARRTKQNIEAGVYVAALDAQTPTSPQDVGPAGRSSAPTKPRRSGRAARSVARG